MDVKVKGVVNVTVPTVDKCPKCGCTKTVDVVMMGAPVNFTALGKGAKPGRNTCKRVFVDCAKCSTTMGTWKVMV